MPQSSRSSLTRRLRHRLRRGLVQLWHDRTVWLITPVVAGVVIGARTMGWLQPVEWMAYDQFIRLRPVKPTDDRIVIVGIDEADLQALQQYPMDDATLAALLEQIKQAQPVAIGLDMFRDFAIAPGTQRLQTLFRTTPNLIGIEKRQGQQDSAKVNPSSILSQAGQTASNNVVLDSDGKLRRGLLFWTEGEESIDSIGLRLASMYLDAAGIQASADSAGHLQLGRATFQPFEANDGNYVGADAGGYQILLNFRGPAKTFRTVSMRSILQGQVPPEQLRNRIVLIGMTAESIRDVFYTPYSGNTITTPEKMPGVEIIANTASQVLQAASDGRASLKFWTEPWEWAWIAGWAAIGTTLAWWIRSPRLAVASLFGLLGLLLSGSYGAFLAGWWIPVIPPVLALTIATVALTGYVASLERRDRAAVMNLFGRYVTPQIAEAIWQDREQLFNQGRLKGQKMPVTVIFTDLKDFSTIAESTDPSLLMEWLNEYMDAMTQVVFQYGGVVDKFIGDAVMALFGVPIARENEAEIQADAQNAVRCAVGMAHALNQLNAQWQQQGRPTLKMRVGICTGTAVTGSLGGQQRMDYTAIGDTVNIAARLESFDKSIDGGICRILVSNTTYDYLDGEFQASSIGSVQLKGRVQDTAVYQILYDLADGTGA